MADSRCRGRNPALDGLRVVAMLGVVLLHITASKLSSAPSSLAAAINGLTRFAVPTFVAVSGYLHARSISSGGAMKAMRSRLARLVPAFVAWTVFYLYDTSGVTLGLPWSASRAVNIVVLGGAKYHLWFLPMLLTLVLIGTLGTTVARRRGLLVAGFALAAFSMFWISLVRGFGLWEWLGVSVTQVSYLTAVNWLLPYAFGMVLAEETRTDLSTRRWPTVAVLAVSSAVLAFSTWAARSAAFASINSELRVVLYVAAVVGGLILVRFAVRTHTAFSVERLAGLAPLIFGIYLIHPFLRTFVLRWFPPADMPGWIWMPLTWILLSALSAAAIWVLLRIPYVRRLLA